MPVAVVLVAALGTAGCGGGRDTLEIAGPTTSSSRIVDLPAGPVSGSTAIVERRLRSAGVAVSAIDYRRGFITARSNENRFVDCGRIFWSAGNQSSEQQGNAPRLVLPDPNNLSGTLIRTVDVTTSAGIGITPGVTNTVVLNQQHRVTIEVSTPGGRVVSTETRDFTDRGFARFEDGTVCRSSDAMSQALL